MTQRLNNILQELKKIKRLGVKDRKKYFKSCSKDCIFQVCECVKNLLDGNLKIGEAHLKKLSRHKKTLRSLAAKNTSLVKRKRLLQKGGFITTLLPILIPALGSLVGAIYSRAVNG